MQTFITWLVIAIARIKSCTIEQIRITKKIDWWTKNRKAKVSWWYYTDEAIIRNAISNCSKRFKGRQSLTIVQIRIKENQDKVADFRKTTSSSYRVRKSNWSILLGY